MFTLNQKAQEAIADVMHKKASLTAAQRAEIPDANFALVYKDTKGKTVRSYPVHDEPRVRSAISYFSKNISNIPATHRRSTAKNIMAAAKKFNVHVESPALQKYAEAHADADSTCKQLQIRYNEVKTRPECVEALEKIAEDLADSGDFEKTANQLYAFDYATGLNKKWNSWFDEPCLGVFREDPKMSKVAAAASALAPYEDRLIPYLGRNLTKQLTSGAVPVSHFGADIQNIITNLTGLDSDILGI
jgi:hypothetical protein